MQVWTLTSPDVFNRFLSTQVSESVVGCNCSLGHQHAQIWECGDVLHGHVIAQLARATEETELRQTGKRLKIVSVQARRVPEETQSKQSVETTQLVETVARE